MSEFLSEDDTKTFEGWLRLQGYADPAALAPTVLADFRDYYETYCNKPHPKVGRAPYAPKNPGDRHYAVAVQDAGELFVVLWVKRVLWKKKEFFVFVPRADAKWDPHTSYHQDGSFHSKSFGHKGLSKK